MYLVEIKPDTEVLYRSVHDLADAIRSGAVGPQARIYHRNSGIWVPITVHPEYRKISDAGELPTSSVLVPEEKKPSVRQLFRGAMRRLRISTKSG